MSKDQCGDHVPMFEKCPDCCVPWRVFHESELKKTHDVSAVFYCPVLSCDQFELNSESQILADIEPLRTTIRLKILYHKLARFEGDGK